MRTRLRAEDGFGLVELVIAMAVLAIALLALVAAFSSGALTLQRAGQTSTASALANQQMELYRGLKYDSIRLDSGSIPPSGDVYRLDSAYNLVQVTSPACPGPPVECDASRAVTGPDGRSYRVDTFIVHETPAGGRELKKVTVVVRDGDALTAGGLVRASSKFDRISG
jgi:prepilin-type N-terminal cleavage/methylation domain-containing protein